MASNEVEVSTLGAVNGAAAVSSECAPVLNFAMEQNGVPLIREVCVRNTGRESLRGAEIEVQVVPDLSKPQRLPVLALAPGAEHRIGPLNHRINSARLRELTEAEQAQVVVRLKQGDSLLAEERRDVRVLTANEWPGSSAPVGLLAAFVTPNHPVIATLLQDVREKLRVSGLTDGLEGYQSGRAERVLDLVRALYQAVQSLSVGYMGVPPSFEDSGQRIRLPDAVLRDRLACCLDVSVLFAAALEGMGLAPLVLLVRGHALLAVWLRDDRFPEGVVQDAARLRTQVALGNVVPLEVTAVTSAEPVDFDVALRLGLERIANDDEFLYAVDVRALRSEYRPIPLRVAQSQDSIATPPQLETSYAARLLARAALRPVEEDRVPEPTTPQTDVDVRFRRWKESLLDLSLRNRMLNFKADAGSAVRLDVPDLEMLEDGLWEGKSFQLLPRPDRDARDQRDEKLAEERTAELVAELRLADFRQRKIHCRFGAEDLWTRLRSLDRDARTALEEGGAVVLYVGIGFLKWFEEASDEQPCLAPLLLIPVELVFDARTRRVSVRRVQDDPVLNVTLVERLRRDYAVDVSQVSELPMAEAGGEEVGVAVAKLLRRFREAIQRLPRWEVLEDVHLGIFHFTKFLMWKDLEDNAEQFLNNAVVRRIASRDAVPLAQNAPVQPDAIDRIHPVELPTVLDADSTQMAAIASALDGQSFVLQGPPGTGKSQTIANIVAAMLARGRTVLFVSEKMAALDVVHRRLRDVGLGDFCLELHSHKANKKDLVASLHAALTHKSASNCAAWKDRCDALVTARGQLNGYVEALHRPGRLGMSVYDARGRLIELHNVPDLRIPRGFAAQLDEKKRDDARAAVDEFAILAGAVEPVAAHPFATSRCATWTAAKEEALREALAVAGDAAQAWTVARGALGSELDAKDLRSDATADLARACASIEAGVSPAPAFSEEWPRRSARARACIEARAKAEQERASMGTRWAPSFVDAAQPELVDRFRRWANAFFIFAWIMLFSARRQLRKHAVGAVGRNADVLADLLVAAKLRSEQAALDAETTWTAELLSTSADERPARWAAMVSALDASHPAARRALAERGDASRVLETLSRPLPPAAAQRIAGAAAAVVNAEAALRTAEASLVELLECSPETVGGWSSAVHPSELLAATERWTGGLGRFREHCLYRAGAAALATQGLSCIAEAHTAGAILAADLRLAFEKAVLRQWHAEALDAEPALRDFDDRRHARRIEEFRALDREHIRLSRQHVLAELERRLPSLNAANIEGSEPALLMRESQKKSRVLPVRRLLHDIPTILPRLKPCFLMSPLSVAQYLPADASFDVVVFDEASQICTHEAIGAIARGKQVMVVGDSRQMPPTSFFSRALDEDGDLPDENDVVELESVLDEAVAKLIPQQSLGWHYRSRHESLIEFSNKHIYESRLDVFPAAEFPNEHLGVAWRRVDGVYRGGNGPRGRTNQIEAEAIVAHLVERLRRFAPEERTFGVVTFNMPQQKLILDLLDEERLDPLVDRHFGGLEPVFVKNLENVQGDERDEIAFSICNAPDENGRFLMSFGAVNLAGGERRLNVAVTRARKQIVVFASFDPERIERGRTKSKGTWLVREFLMYARDRGTAARPTSGVASSDNAQDRAVTAALREAGLEVHSGVGCGRYRLDAAVLDPVIPGRYTVAVEADGPAYRSAASARDRDRLRAEVLEKLDWRVERVWTSSWYFDPANTRNAIIERVRTAALHPRKPLVTAAPPAIPPPAARAVPASDPVHAARASPPPPPLPIATRLRDATPYQSYVALAANAAAPERLYDARSSTLIREQLLQAIQTEGPIHEKVLARRVLGAWSISNVTARPTRRLGEQLEELERSRCVLRRGDFLWPLSLDPASWRGFRHGELEEQSRELSHVAPEELANAAEALLREAGSLERDALLREVAALFGIERLGQRVREAIDCGVEVLLASGRCTSDGTRLRLNSNG